MATTEKTIPSVNEVVLFLRDILVVKKQQYKTERAVETIVTNQLRETFGDVNVHRQYNVGGFLSLKCDIDLFDSKCCGIELKLAKQLIGSYAKERLIGQAIYYSKRCYQEKLIILVIGSKKEYDTSLKEVQLFLQDLGIHFIYKELA